MTIEATIDGWVSDAAQRDADKVALIFQGDRITYGAMADMVKTRANALAAAGVGRGDRVAWYGLNHSEIFILIFACARLGAIFVPLNWRLAPAEIARIASDCAPKLCIYDDHFADAAQALTNTTPLHHNALPTDAPDHEPSGATTSDALMIVYTSGSTGSPKGAVLAQKALIANAQMSIDAHGMTTEDNVLNVLPMFHVGGLNILPTPAFSIGATVTILERFEPAAALTALTGATLAIMVPTVMQAIMSRPGWATADFSRLRGMSIGSTDVPRALIDAAHERGIPMHQVYGATETCPFAIYQRLDEAIETAGSLGRVGIACQARLMLPNGTEAPIGEPGEIWIKGDNILTEYWNNPEESARAITDGWFHSGDVATLDENGLYWFTDRIKHVVISGGENIYPAELERVLNTLPGVTEAAVVGRPDPKWGEIPVAVIVGDIDRDEVLNAFHGALARYKHPRDVVFVNALPRNAMGKVVAAEVRKLV